MARDKDDKDKQESIIQSLSIDQDAVRHRVHRQMVILKQTLDVESSDPEVWVDEVFKATELVREPESL